MPSALSLVFLLSSVLFASAVALLALKNLHGTTWSRSLEAAYALVFAAAALEMVFAFEAAPLNVLVALYGLILLTVVVTAYRARCYSVAGILFFAANTLLSAVALVWGLVFIWTIDVSVFTRTLLVLTVPLLFLTLPFGVLHMIEQFDVLCRIQWRRPRDTKKRRASGSEPMVSLHVPTYAEPPEIVIGTLNAISKLRYTNYEVIVVDNNTKDEALWRPVAAHCARLGAQFRFFHVDPLEGAKAGALNFALSHTNPTAQVVGVIDSDYQAHPDFIADLIGHFEDSRIGFVQTPHDYRDWEENTFLTMCYWEYKAFFHTILVALNERDAALTIGTMCLIRRRALEEVGGWATWCLTEDSELSIRLHDLGYSSVYVPHTYGRGLIPETFSGYRKQRRRWIAGPVQELQHHLGRFFGWAAGDSRLTTAQRLHHVHHGWGSVMLGLNVPILVCTLVLAISMVWHAEVIAVPTPLWAAVTVLFVSNIVLHWLHFRVILHASLRDMVFGVFAHKALSHSVHMSALTTALQMPQRWHRTNKFAESQTISASLWVVRSETMIGLVLAGSAIVLYAILPAPGLLTMCLIGIGYKSLDYLAAPLVSYVAARSSRKTAPAIDMARVPVS